MVSAIRIAQSYSDSSFPYSFILFSSMCVCLIAFSLVSVQEISLFPVASLKEIGLSNLSRASLVWPSITTHLTMVSQCAVDLGEKESYMYHCHAVKCY